MADILHFDSFWYPSAAIPYRYPGVSSITWGTFSGGRRANSYCLRSLAGVSQWECVLGAYKYWLFGVAVKTIDWNNSSLFGVKDGSTLHTDIRVDGGGILTATRNGTLLGSSGVVLPKTTYTFIEVSLGIDDSAGFVQVRQHGSSTPILNLTSIDTRNAGNATADRLFFGVTLNREWTDLYIKASNSNTLTFLGDKGVAALLANGNGATSQGVGSDGNSTNNYLLVDDPLGTLDWADYVDFQSAGDLDTYAFEDAPAGLSSITAVQLCAALKKTDAGNAVDHKFVIRQGSTNYTGTKQTSVGTGEAIVSEVFETQPNGAGAWTASAVNAAEYGNKREV